MILRDFCLKVIQKRILRMPLSSLSCLYGLVRMVHQLFSDPWFLWDVSASRNVKGREIHFANFSSRQKSTNPPNCLFFKTVLTLCFLLEHMPVVMTQNNSTRSDIGLLLQVITISPS